jgi:hypothetical protein
MELPRCTPTHQQHSNDTKNMVIKCHGLGDLKVTNKTNNLLLNRQIIQTNTTSFGTFQNMNMNVDETQLS